MSIDEDLLEVFASMSDTQELDRLFEDLLTPAEREDVCLRWKLMKDLHQGMTQRKIAGKYGISLCKITRGSKILKNKDSVVLKVLDDKTED